MNYWNDDLLLRARSYEDDQNMLLRTAYFWTAAQYNDLWKNTEINDIALIGSLFFNSAKMLQDGRIAQHPYTTYQKDPASHDELTAFLWVNVNKQEILDQIKVFPFIHQPQVFFHLLHCKFKWKWALFISCLWFLVGTWKKEKSKNGLWDTDGELLTILKLRTYREMNSKPYFVSRTLKNIAANWGPEFEKNLINQMLTYEPEHPLRRLFRENITPLIC